MDAIVAGSDAPFAALAMTTPWRQEPAAFRWWGSGYTSSFAGGGQTSALLVYASSYGSFTLRSTLFMARKPPFLDNVQCGGRSIAGKIWFSLTARSDSVGVSVSKGQCLLPPTQDSSHRVGIVALAVAEALASRQPQSQIMG